LYFDLSPLGIGSSPFDKFFKHTSSASVPRRSRR
jgi:hypothetical protein